MRAWALPVALLLLVGALAGCVNTPKDTNGGAIDPAGGNKGTTTGGTGTGTGTGTTVTILPPLALTVTGPAGKWLAPGASVDVAAKGPSGVAYVWAIGPLPGTVQPADVKLNTGSAKDASDWIQPGDSKSLTFSKSGVFQMHCHPHPYMLSNVTVVDGYEGTAEVAVSIVDGDALNSYRFVPENIVIAPGTKVTYTNKGQQPHTATMMSAEPALKKLALTAASGSVALEGDGWQRIRVIAVDTEGRLGAADIPVYLKPLPTFAPEPFTMEFNAGGLPEEAVPSITKSFTLESNTSLKLAWSFQDALAAGGAPVNNAEVDIHLFPQGSEQDVFTSETVPEGEGAAKALAGVYTLKVVAKKGVQVSGVVTITGEAEDPTPPAPAMASAGGEAHGGHAH